MMIRKVILLMLVIASVSMENSGKEEMERDAKTDMATGDYCDISDFEDFHYYLFCNTNIGTTAASVNPTVNAFIGNDAETAEAGVELYQKFMEPFWENDHEGYMELSALSSDAQLAITGEDVEGNASLKKWRFFEGETEKEQREVDNNYNCPFRIIKNGDAYAVIDGETLDKKEKRLKDETGYYCVEFNEQGDLAGGDKYNKSNDTWEMAICDLENAEVLWTFYQGDKYGYVWQIQGDRESGKVVYELDNRSFYEYTYPSGETRYLGKDMYYPCYSPDGKYIAYSSPDNEACFDLDAEEAEEVDRILPGIYILEVETGKTAYIRQDIHDIADWAEQLNTRAFQWVEKDCFERVMKERDAKSDMTTGDYCGMDEFEELNYYLFCCTQLHEGAGGFTFRPSIIGSETQTIEEAKQLYQEFAERLPLDFEEKETECDITYVSDVSPDCKCVITSKWSEHETMRTQILFYEKEKVREEVNEVWVENRPMLIVKDGDRYREMDEEHYEMLSKLKEESHDEGYLPIWRINAEGNLLAGVRDNFSLLTIREIEDGAEQWSFSLQGIREEVAQIRDDIKEGDTVLVTVQQFEGDEKEGWLTVQAGRSSFFRIAYPSGEVTYLGEYMYSACFSPDGKYVAYSSDVDYDNGVDMEPEEYERVEKICPPGICVREIETGKTAYLYWDPNKNPEEDYMEYRHFMWLEKEGFEEYMAGSRENTQDTPSKDTEISDAISNEENSYFFNDDRVYLEAKAKYDDWIHSEFVEEFVCAEMRFIKQYEQGSVYKLVIEPLGALTDERLNIYFYVTNSKIYRLWSYVYQEDRAITFYDDDELLVKVLDTDEKLINNGQTVCQDEELQCELKEGDSEFHFAIIKQGKQVEYSSYTITPNGEIYYYENFMWEEGKGLIEFGSGYRAERDPLYLTEITQISAREYKRRLYMMKPSIGDCIY